MLCNEFLEYSERWMDGERDASAAAHLKSCAHCSALIADLESIGNAAQGLAEVTPPERVWVSLRNQLEAEGLVKEPVEAVAALPAPSHSGTFFALRPVFATSLLALLMVFGGFYAYQGGVPNAPTRVAQDPGRDGSEVMAELAALAQAPAPEMHEHNPLVTASFKQNLETVDKAIAMCEKTVKEQPNNEMAREYLLSAYQQKADLLASMSQRGAIGD